LLLIRVTKHIKYNEKFISFFIFRRSRNKKKGKTHKTLAKSYRQSNRFLSSIIATSSEGFFIMIPLIISDSSKTSASLFIYFDGRRITSFYKFIGKAPYKGFNKFINKTLSENSILESKKI
jgi:hypothetical protein